MPCAPGWHGTEESLTGLRACTPCEPGTLQPRAGETRCVACPPEGVDCSLQDRIEVLPGWYRHIATSAATATEDADADADDDDDVSADAATAANATAPLLTPVRCPRREGCLGGANESDGSCAEGHRGPLCGICREGYYHRERSCAR